MIPSKPLAYVSSALNACQAFDILFLLIVCRKADSIKKETPGRKESLSKRYGYPFRAGGLSSNMSGLTFRFIYLGIDLEKDLCSLFHLSLSVVSR